jgi:hypothetical protein
VSAAREPEDTRFPDKGWDGWLKAHPMIAVDADKRDICRTAYYGGWMARRPTKLTVFASLGKWFLALATLAFYVYQLVGKG